MTPAAAGILELRPGSPGYPDLLASIPDAPSSLFIRGRLGPAPALALVGSRRPTPYGLRAARRLASEAARAGIVTVSGLARGIDTEAHRAALQAGGVTWAVLGSGLDIPYPPENAALLEEVVERGGAAVSELPPGTPPHPAHFPRRNRIISGLAWAVVVVEGDSRSGALITARCALEQGREVFAVPGPVDSPLSDGPLALLRDGAAPAGRLQDILDASEPLRAAAEAGRSKAPLDAAEEAGGGPSEPDGRKVLSLLGSESLAFEDLLRETGWAADRLARILAEMEVEGRVVPCPGQRYARR